MLFSPNWESHRQQLDVIDLTEEPTRDEKSIPGGYEGCS